MNIFFRFHLLWAFLAVAGTLALSACASHQSTPTITPLVSTIEGKSVATTGSSMRIADPNGCFRPYARTSIWNVAIDWKLAHIHPQSPRMIEAFFEGENWIGSNTAKYAANIYFVNNSTPLVPVTLHNRFRNVISDNLIEYGTAGGTIWMPLPPEALPAPGTDGQLAVVNLDTGEEWGLIEGSINVLGNWSADGAYRYFSVYASGIPPKGFSQRGAGIGNLAGVVFPCEVQRGEIFHAVTLAYDAPCAPEICSKNDWPEVIPPFSKTDGEGFSQFDIPEGARLAIRPEISKDDINSACSGKSGCVAWAIAMQKYGGFIVDNSGHPKTYGEGDATANWSPDVWSAEMLRNIPPDWYVVLDWNYPATSIAE